MFDEDEDTAASTSKTGASMSGTGKPREMSGRRTTRKRSQELKDKDTAESPSKNGI